MTEGVLENDSYPRGFKVIRRVASDNVDDKDHQKNAHLSHRSKIYPDLESRIPMPQTHQMIKLI